MRSRFRTRYLLAFLLFVLSGVAFLDRTNIAIAGGQISAAYGLGNQRLGWVFSAFLLGYAVFQLPAGWLAARYGPRRVLSLAALCWGAATIVTAVLHTGMPHALSLLFLVRLLLGAGDAVVYPAANQFVARWVPIGERGVVNGIIFAGVGAGSGLTPPFLNWLIAHHGWRAAFWFSAAVGAAVGVLWWFLARDTPEEHSRVTASELAEIYSQSGTAPARRTGRPARTPIDWARSCAGATCPRLLWATSALDTWPGFTSPGSFCTWCRCAALICAYRHVEVASVSDAMEQLLHRKGYLSHQMQGNIPAKFAGTAVTVLLKKQENSDPHALDGMLQAIDGGGPGSVYVMQVEDGADIAGMGGLMGTAMSARGYVGAVIDGGVRDLPQLRRINFPVYSLGAVPSTSVGHYRFSGADIPILCDGVEVNGGDIVVADADGVAVVPKAQAAEVLVKAQALDNAEHSMYPYIEKYHSIVEAVQKFGRI